MIAPFDGPAFTLLAQLGFDREATVPVANHLMFKTRCFEFIRVAEPLR